LWGSDPYKNHTGGGEVEQNSGQGHQPLFVEVRDLSFLCALASLREMSLCAGVFTRTPLAKARRDETAVFTHASCLTSVEATVDGVNKKNAITKSFGGRSRDSRIRSGAPSRGTLGSQTRTPLKQKSRPLLVSFMSGYQDSNLGPSGPKPDALPDCATSRTI